MEKIRVEAREVLADIHAGMDDLPLMKKYSLSPVGLLSLFRKLKGMGLLRVLNARQVHFDLESGMSNDELMKKYDLSAKGLRNLFTELDRVHPAQDSMLQEESPDSGNFPITEIAASILSGTTRPDLLRRYRLSERGLKWISSVMVSEGFLSWQDVYQNICTGYEDLVPDKVRQQPRFKALHCVPVYEAGRPEARGMIGNLSEKGIGIRGIEARAGETKDLVIPADPFGEFATFDFSAECRWAHKKTNGEYISGFQISHISIRNSVEFQILMKLLRSAPL
jgi:hypothetical protein